MSFWDTNDQKTVENSGEFDGGGGKIELIPDDTGCIAQVSEASWSNFDDDNFITIKWDVMKPSEYANRKVFQKIRVMDKDPNKADKAKRMLYAIDKNCGGKLGASSYIPDDAALMSALCGNMMAIKVMVWEIKAEDSRDGQGRKGNWVRAVQPKGSGGQAKAQQQAKPQPQQQAPQQAPKTQQTPQPQQTPDTGIDDDDDDEIPF